MKTTVDAPASPHKPRAPIMSSPAKKGACFIRKARQLHKAKKEPYANAALSDAICKYGYLRSRRNNDFINPA